MRRVMTKSGPGSAANRWRRRAGTVLGLAALAVAAVAVPGDAFADSTVDQVLWANCQSESSASLLFDVASLNWLDSTVLRYSATIGADCGTNTQTEIVEGTPQPNDNPQTFSLGYGGGRAFSSALTVTPVRSLTWKVLLVNPLGQKELRPADPHDHRTAGIAVNYPAGTLDSGQTAVTVTANSVAQRWTFVKAVQTPGATVRIAGDVNLDLSGLNAINLAPNVQILGDRGVNPLGPRLFTTTEPANLFVVPPSIGSHERISGIRLQGGSSTDPFANMGDEDSNAIQIHKAGVEIDHSEIYLWRGAGVSVIDCEDCTPGNLINRGNASTVWIHDNYIHHDQHPTGDICCGHGGGYGVSVVHGAYALVEKNVFDYNRHSMMAGGDTGTGYLFYRNLILPNGGVNSHVSSTHAIDVHGTNGDDSYESGQAGEYFDVEYNTVWNIHGPAVKLRGTPTDTVGGMEVSHNAFGHCALLVYNQMNGCAPALVQTESGLHESDNTLGASSGSDARTTCDFDGDAVNDTFHATGVTLWFESTRLGGRYVYLTQSSATGAALQLGDRNNDGLCDVVAGGTTFLSDPANVVGPAVATVPFLVPAHESDARGYITAAGLTVGTVTYTRNPAPPGTVVDQSPHWGYVRPAGSPVSMVVSTGQVTVPNVLGYDEASARSTITSAGLTVGTASHTNTCVDPGTVQNQSPQGGVATSPGASVNITISTCTNPGGGGGGGGGGGPILPK